MGGSMKYLDLFLREAEEHLASLQKGLLDLEKSPEPALIHELMRNAHTLKGSARMLGFESISSVAHRMEDYLIEMEEGLRPVEGKWIDLLLKGSDAIARLTAAMVRGEEAPIDVEKLLHAFDTGETGEEKEAPQPQQQPEQDAVGETVRARVSTLDNLVNLVGELIISRKRFESRISSLQDLALEEGRNGRIEEFRRGLEEEVQYLDYLIQSLHGEAMTLRMLPLKTVTEGFHRMVRDIARDQGKEADLVISGDEIEVDRVLLEALKPIFLHMLTNSMDHGVESPEERAAAGKPTRAVITVAAVHEGNTVRIEVRDDGRGMDPHRIRKTAVRRGIVDAEEADRLSDEEALYLTLRPGFSTSEIVTDISGRGVGMDVVKKSLEKVKGTLHLSSTPGKGTEMVMHLPLSLSVIDALMVACCGEPYAIPLTYVQETIRIRSEHLATAAGKEVVNLRGAAVPLVSLGTLLGAPGAGTFDSGRLSAIVLRQRDRLLACAVDEITGSSEIVVKNLGRQLRNVRHVFGATITGDGSPAIILNVPEIFETSEQGEGASFRKAFEAKAAAKRKGHILVVDDSITTRTMERSILVAHGYRVEIAVSGEDALEKSAAFGFDLVISDVEMPGINGFELTRRLRATETYREIPVIIVSSLSRDQDKRKAIDAGAQAYIVKGSFEQGVLLETVEALIG